MSDQITQQQMIQRLEAELKEKREGKIDDRHVAICAVLAAMGMKMREEIFQHIEAENFEEAFLISDELVKLDRCYMLSMKTGLDMVKSAREEKEKDPNSPEHAAMMERMAKEQARIDAEIKRRNEEREKLKALGAEQPT